MGGSKKTETTQQERAPWAPAQAGLQDVLDRSRTLAGDTSVWTPTYSSGTTDGVRRLGEFGAGPSFGANTMRGVIGNATAGMGAGTGQMEATARGDYLNSNRYLDPVLSKIMQETGDRVNAQFSAAGRFGSGAHTGVLTQELGGLDAKARLDNYMQERQNQINAAGNLSSLGMQGASMAPQVDAAAAAQIGYGLQAGQMQDAMDEAKRKAGVNAVNWQAGITTPIAGLGGTSSGTTTSTNTPSMGQQIMGGAMMGASILGAPFTGGASLAGLGAGASMFGSSMPGTAANGGWATTVKPSLFGW